MVIITEKYIKPVRDRVYNRIYWKVFDRVIDHMDQIRNWSQPENRIWIQIHNQIYDNIYE